MAELRNSDVYKAEMKKYGTGSALQQGIQAATAAVQGLAGGDMSKALAGASAPYLAEVIHNMTTDPVTGKVNTEANLMAHAVLGAVVAQVNGNSVLAGASGAVMGEYIAQKMYPGINREDLTEEQRQTISALGTLAAGLAGGVVGNSTADAVAGAQAGKNAVENNYLSVQEKTELELAKQKLQNSTDPAEREKAQQKYDALMEKDIASDKKVIDACGNGNAGSAACVSARLEVITAKGEYETGPYNSKVSQQYSDAYGQIVNLLNITSVDAQNQQQVKDAMVNYAMVQLGVDKATAEAYIETYDGMKIVAASMTPVLGGAAAAKLKGLMAESSIRPANQKYVDILSPEAKQHILYGDSLTSGGHLYPGNPGKTVFPQNWSADKVVHAVGDIATSPDTQWFAQTGTGGIYTSKGKPANWVSYETRDGVRIRVVYQPATGKIVTAFPDNAPIPSSYKKTK
ncbi:TPA: VENN motif pre-toxin domain-containing protein [Yersinia enterocolitica]|nr:VENN motif pre-toxin domain-containing protein [Yersinia enterocolitica]